MAKKDFKKSSIDKLFSNTQETHDTEETQNAHETPQKREYYRFNLKMPIEFKDGLTDSAWDSRMQITQYINELIETDLLISKKYGKAAHKEQKTAIKYFYEQMQ